MMKRTKTLVSVVCMAILCTSCQGADATDSEVVRRHAAVARRAAGESMVLLKNDGVLPLAKGSSVALFGNFDEYHPGGGGSSCVKPVRTVTVPQGLEEAGFKIDPASRDTAIFVIARKASESSDCPDEAFELSAGERVALDGVKAAGFRRIVVVCNCGNALNLASLEADSDVGAILWTWFPGGEGGAAVGDILSGAVNPSGRLAATFARRVGDYPSDAGFRDSRWFVPYEDDIFVGYRYFETIPGAKDKVVYPFGHGLSYTTWKVSDEGWRMGDGNVEVNVKVTNTGKVAGRHSVLVYTGIEGGRAEHPARELRAFAKTRLLAPGESEVLAATFPVSDLAFFDDGEQGTGNEERGTVGCWVVDGGKYTVYVGGSVGDARKIGSFALEGNVLAAPGLKLQSARLARRLRGDGTYAVSPVAYQGHLEPAHEPEVRTNETSDIKFTLRDVAEGRTTLDAFLDQMSLQEMLRLCIGHPGNPPYPLSTGAIGDLAEYGVTPAQTCDGPAGIRRTSVSTYFPCAALLASSFDPMLLKEIGGVVGAEAADGNYDLLLAPGLCIHRHPLCGRNFEYFSEDPFVAGVCATAYVEGVQKNGVGATIKHFAGNNRETARRIEKDVVSERAFREIYLRGFERAVKESRPWAVMTAYNGVNGYNTSEHYGLLTGILRGEWGFEGLTISDWKTTVPLWREIAAGNDGKMPFEFEHTNMTFAPEGDGVREAVCAYGWGYLSAAKVRESARRVVELVLKSATFRKRLAEASSSDVGSLPR